VRQATIRRRYRQRAFEKFAVAPDPAHVGSVAK
jgi:hypothetical protein